MPSPPPGTDPNLNPSRRATRRARRATTPSRLSWAAMLTACVRVDQGIAELAVIDVTPCAVVLQEVTSAVWALVGAVVGAAVGRGAEVCSDLQFLPPDRVSAGPRGRPHPSRMGEFCVTVQGSGGNHPNAGWHDGAP